MLKKFIQIFSVSVATFILSYYILGLFFAQLNSNFLYYIKNHQADKVSRDIIVVEIDDKSYNRLGFPLDRSDYIPFLKNLEQANTAVVGFDILFLDPSKIVKKDIDLAKSLQSLGNVVLGIDIKDDSQAILPYEVLSKSAKALGYFQPFINPNTKKVSSIEPFRELRYKNKDVFFDSFAFAMLREYYSHMYGNTLDTTSTKISDTFYETFGKKIPIQNSTLLGYRDVQEFQINYVHPQKFQRESFYNIYTGDFDPKKFENKIVLVGYTAEGVKDDFFVPNFGVIKGVYVHANVINNILNENYVVFFNKTLELSLSFLFIIFIVYMNVIFLKNKNLRWITLGAVVLFLCILALYFVLFVVSFRVGGIYLQPNYPFEFVAVLGLSFFVSSVLKYINEDKNKKMLSKALSEYVSSDIAHEILHSTGNVNLSGENKRITTFFSDIAGFTTLSEKLSPEELVGFLREYLGEMSNIIIDHKGFVNKYEGDAIMALWGVFGRVENYGVNEACYAALLQQKRLQELNDMWKSEGKDTFQVRMGIHTGNAIIGNIGAEGRKMEFTALGDTVNLGSRLEGVNKYYNTHICVSHDVYELTKELFEYRMLDKIRVKGKNNALYIYELVGEKNTLSDLKKQSLDMFALALERYFEKNFSQAKQMFENLVQLNDAPSKIYVDRCQKFLENPPQSDWDGVWSMTDK